MPNSKIKSSLFLLLIAAILQSYPFFTNYLSFTISLQKLPKQVASNLEEALASNVKYNFFAIQSAIELEVIPGISSNAAPKILALKNSLQHSNAANDPNFETHLLSVSGIGAVKAQQLKKIFFAKNLAD